MSGSCDRCGKYVDENDYIPLNAIPRDRDYSVPFQLKMRNWCDMKTCILCKDCVESFFDWWKDGDGK